MQASSGSKALRFIPAHPGTAATWPPIVIRVCPTRESKRTFVADAVRLQLHALVYNLGNFMRTLAVPKAAEPWSLTSLEEKLVKIGAKVVSHGR